MKKILVFLFILPMIISCAKVEEPEPEPCSELVNGIYIYPTEKPDSTLTNEEKREHWNIPDEVLSCISTKGLVRSCFQMPFSIFISAGTGYQHGYQVVKGWNRGFEELETRDDAPEELINFYDSITIHTAIDYRLFCIEVLMAQDAILTKLTNEQKIRLLNLCLTYHPEIMKIWTKTSFLFDGTIVIMCQIMRLDKYQPFINLVLSDPYLKTFEEGYSYSLLFEQGDSIVAHTHNYLQELTSSIN